MKKKIKNFWSLLKVTVKTWWAREPFRQSAVIAYYAIFSIPGLLVLIITIAGYFYGKDVASQSILEEVTKTMGSETAAQMESMFTNAAKTDANIWKSILGIGILLVGATGVFVELQAMLNKIWQVKPAPIKGYIKILRARLFSFGLILAIAFLLLISLAVSTALSAIGNWIQADTSEFMAFIFNIINFAISLVIISVLFAAMFKILPDAKIQWKHVWLGGLLTGILFTIGKTALAFYFGKADPASGYGAAGSVILILLWVSYSSMIMFFGAEFTAVYAKEHSGKIVPSDFAVKDKSAAVQV
jgi:membrane protein